MSKKSEKGKRVSDKIKYLRSEGVSEKQAVGEAEGIERSGRLRKGGRYERVSKRGRRKSTRS
jgi:hypothetical protein